MAKEISGFIKLQIKGGQANPAPPVGPALGQRSVAQLVERRSPKPEAEGSSPSAPANLK